MTKETVQYQPLLSSLLDAAKRKDWDLVDKVLAPQLPNVDGNEMAKALLGYAGDGNPNIRDLVATCLVTLSMSDQEVVVEAITAMAKMASEDEEVFPAGRAAAFLVAQKGRSDGIETAIKEALITFYKRAKEKGWEAELEENIPGLVSKLPRLSKS